MGSKRSLKTNNKIMVQGTASSVGKSVLCTALCRIFKQDGYSVAPFKSQNMALNSYVTADGGEMGRAQVMQAEAAGIAPLVEMNPLLLKPTSDQGSQVIVMGKPVGNITAMDYQEWKNKLLPVIDDAYNRLSNQFDVIVIEGAGSPAEINLKDNDFVNMGLAKRIGAPVLLVGDIDRGGVFASLFGTAALLDDDERSLLKGVVINKFRGDPEVLKPGLKQLEALINLPVLGVIPYFNIVLDDEDSVTDRFKNNRMEKVLNIQVVLLPRISNFTDFNPLEIFEDVNLAYIHKPEEIDNPDLLIIPGSKNTIEDLLFLRETGWTKPIHDYVQNGGFLMGICGGFQMLGMKLSDPRGMESSLAEISGFGFLDFETKIEKEKLTQQVEAYWGYSDDRFFTGMKGEKITGYEIHMGQTTYFDTDNIILVQPENRWDGAVGVNGQVFGTYIHGIFDNLSWTEKLLNRLKALKGISKKSQSPYKNFREFKEIEYNKLADLVRANIDMNEIYKIIGLIN
ncbi:MAG: cobyric acid synthase [Bacillota bacterium]|nr:cobyric acid synthase [Bacillota bacterium]